jgi:hypothetical protein
MMHFQRGKEMDQTKPLSEIVEAASRVCRNCLEANLIEDVKIARCSKCSNLYCIHFASNIDPQYCVECLSDINMHREVIVKTYRSEVYDEETDTVTVSEYKRRARLIRLDGMHWLFAQRKIASLSDEALELTIEYHKEILTGLHAEKEDRRIKHLHRNASIPGAAGSGQVNVDTTSSYSTETKKTKTISSTKATASANALLNSMMASGMSMDEILKKITDMQSKVVTK